MRRRIRLPAGIACAAASLALLAGCASSTGSGVVQHGAPKMSVGEPRVLANLQYVDDGTAAHRLDACLPRGASSARPAVIVVHGGSFTMGDKATEGPRYVCERLARAGYDAFSVNYRLLPGHPYPDALDDLRAAISWIRASDQAKRFDLDPRRVGALGESAGAVLVSEVGTGGSGALTQGVRLRAVVGLSTASSFQVAGTASGQAVDLALAYLGCSSLTNCPNATRASAAAFVDKTDPPFLLAASKGDWIPVVSTTSFAAKLKAAGVPVETDVEQGSEHGLQLLNGDLTKRILSFYARYL